MAEVAIPPRKFAWLSRNTVGLLELVASIVAGLLWDHVGHAAVFLYGAVFAAVGAGALLVLVPGGLSDAAYSHPPTRQRPR